MSIGAAVTDRLGRARTRRPVPAPSPASRGVRPFVWSPGDVIGLLWTTVGGLTGLLVSYLGVSSTDQHDTQTVWVGVGIGAVMLAGLGNAVWLAAGARAVAERRRAVIRRLDALMAPARAGATPGPSVTVADLPDRLVVATDAMTRYHRADCLLARGKPVTAATPESHREAGRRPCGVCQPDGGPD